MDPTERQAAALAAVPTCAEGMPIPRLNGHFDGVRRILERHAPDPLGYCRANTHGRFAVRWEECDDWRDAAAGLPLDQELAGYEAGDGVMERCRRCGKDLHADVWGRWVDRFWGLTCGGDVPHQPSD